MHGVEEHTEHQEGPCGPVPGETKVVCLEFGYLHNQHTWWGFLYDLLFGFVMHAVALAWGKGGILLCNVTASNPIW